MDCGSGQINHWLNFGGDRGLHGWVNEQKNSIAVVTRPDRGVGNDPEPLGLSLHQQGPTFNNAYCQFDTKLSEIWGQYGRNDLPCPRTSAFFECFI